MNDSKFKKNNLVLKKLNLDIVSDDSESGRIKGSIKDRIISFLYRKRLKIKFVKKNILIKKETIIVFIKKRIRDNNIQIHNVRDLKKLGKKVIDVDLKNEIFDFDKYDYYLIEPVRRKGIDEESIIIENQRNIIRNSKKIIENINKNINKININNKYPKDHQENVENTKKELVNNIFKLKDEIIKLPLDDKKFNVLKLNKDELPIKAKEIVDYYELKLDEHYKNLKVSETISKVQFKKNVGINLIKKEKLNEKKQNLQSVKNNESLKVSGSIVKISKENKNKISNKNISITKKTKVEKVFDIKKIENIKNIDNKLKEEIVYTKELVSKMDKEVSKVTKTVDKITRYMGFGRIIKSCLKIATGILTLPFSGINIFNITLGSALINKGLHGIRKGLQTKSEIEVNYKYEDLTEKIRKTKDKTKLTELLIMDSLYQINLIKKDIYYMDSSTLDNIMKLEKSLTEKLNDIKNINNKLKNQEEKNKIKLKKVKREI